MSLRIPLTIELQQHHRDRSWPATRGVPLPPGELHDLAATWVENPAGDPVPAQLRPLSRWPDGSIKWLLADFPVAPTDAARAGYALCAGEAAPEAAPAPVLQVEESATDITVCTGPLRFSVSREHFSLVERAELGQVSDSGEFVAGREVVAPGAGGESWVRICESFSDEDGKRRIYGMGGTCLASLARDDYRVAVEEAGPLRAVIRCSGAYEADIPAHHYAGYQPFRYIVRLCACAGESFIRVLHTLVVTCNPRETEVEEIGVRVPFSVAGDVEVRTGEIALAQSLTSGEELLAEQLSDDRFSLKLQGPESPRLLARGERSEGWMTVDDGRAGLGVGLRYMPEEFPKAIRANRPSPGVDLLLWKDSGHGRLAFNRYSEEVSWDEGEGVYSDGTGAAKTSEYLIHFFDAGEAADTPDRMRGLLSPPHVGLDPAWTARCGVTGGFAPGDTERFPASERMMTGFLDWMTGHVHTGRWYGFLDWGDVRAMWDHEVAAWRFYGRWGWCNSEWDPRHGLWIQYLRTADAGYYPLAEAMTRHSMDVDTCHFHPFRPYMVGGGFRHSIDHFGDEPCASHTFLDNWIDYYYLTGDLRTLEVLREAGEFLLRYRWTENPDYSFSLRSIANVLRGLLYVYEVTGEERFMQRAGEVYEVIARGQNEDGSWHKRFQVSTPDKLPRQLPYGMATEGTTLAVEMGTAAPFTEDEFRKLWGDAWSGIRELPLSEQKGYQTHYLMIGIELFHRMTGRADVAEVYRRAVDWFCGFPEGPHAETAIAQRYGGVICRHLAYAYRLTGNRQYLEIGREVLRGLIADQDWSDDPMKRGAVELSATSVSLLFFGVPCLLEQLEAAGMGE